MCAPQKTEEYVPHKRQRITLTCMCANKCTRDTHAIHGVYKDVSTRVKWGWVYESYERQVIFRVRGSLVWCAVCERASQKQFFLR